MRPAFAFDQMPATVSDKIYAIVRDWRRYGNIPANC